MMLLPLAEAAVRKLFSGGIPGAGTFVQHLTLWVAFLGAALAAREGKLLALATGEFLSKGATRNVAGALSGGVGALATALLFRASLDLVVSEREFGAKLTLGVPVWLTQVVLPVAFLVIALRLVWRSSETWRWRIPAAAGLLAGLLLGQFPGWLEGLPAWPAVLLVVVAMIAGMGVFRLITRRSQVQILPPQPLGFQAPTANRGCFSYSVSGQSRAKRFWRNMRENAARD